MQNKIWLLMVRDDPESGYWRVASAHLTETAAQHAKACFHVGDTLGRHAEVKPVNIYESVNVCEPLGV